MATVRQLERLEAHETVTTYTDEVGGRWVTHQSSSEVAYLTLGDRNIAYRFVSVNGMPTHVSVAGIKASKVYATPGGVSVIDVEAISEDEQARVRDMFTDMLGVNKDEVKFWT